MGSGGGKAETEKEPGGRWVRAVLARGRSANVQVVLAVLCGFVFLCFF